MNDISMSLLPLVRGGHAHPGSSRNRDRNLQEESSRGGAPGLATDEILGAGLMDVVMHEVRGAEWVVKEENRPRWEGRKGVRSCEAEGGGPSGGNKMIEVVFFCSK